MKDNEFIRQLKDLKIYDSHQLVNICKEIFIKRYGIETFKSTGLNFIKTKDQLYNNYLEKMYQIDFAVFSQIYEHYLSLHNKDHTGSFYTPDYIIDYMVKKSLFIYLHDQTGISKRQLFQLDYSESWGLLESDQIKNVLHAIENIKVIDIACGTGLFLIQYFKKIYFYKKNLYGLLDEDIKPFDIKKSIIENNLFGIDIQKEPVAIAKLVLLSLAYDQNNKESITFINQNIFVADSLTQDYIFNKEPLKDVFSQKSGFDIVIGNPPYIGEKGNKPLFDRVNKTPFGQKYYEGKMDYFYFFIYKALEILKPKGVLSYITTNYFITADGAVKLRNYLKQNATFVGIINFNNYQIFKSAKGQHNMIFFLKKGKYEKQPVKIKYIRSEGIREEDIKKFLGNLTAENQKINQYTLSSQDELYGFKNNHILIQENNQYNSILKKIYNKKHCTLKELCNVNQGIVSGADKVTKNMIETKFSSHNIHKTGVREDQGIFVLEQDEAEHLGFIGVPYLKPMYKNSDIHRYVVEKNTSKWILYITDDTFSEFGMLDQKILNHLGRYKEVLEKRRETLQGRRNWYALQWPRNQEIFEGLKIVVPHRAKENKFALTALPWYASADVYFITARSDLVDLHFLLAQLNSKIMYFWLYNCGKRKGECLELYANPLKDLPILLDMNKQVYNKIIKLVEKILVKGENLYLQKSIDELFYNLYQLTNSEIEIIEQLHQRNLKK